MIRHAHTKFPPLEFIKKWEGNAANGTSPFHDVNTTTSQSSFRYRSKSKCTPNLLKFGRRGSSIWVKKSHFFQKSENFGQALLYNESIAMTPSLVTVDWKPFQTMLYTEREKVSLACYKLFWYSKANLWEGMGHPPSSSLNKVKHKGNWLSYSLNTFVQQVHRYLLLLLKLLR